MEDVLSDLKKIDIGVPQGSILEPMLFLIYINGLANTLTLWSNVNLFADDTDEGITATNKMQMLEKQTVLMNSRTKWCSINGIGLNTRKPLL